MNFFKGNLCMFSFHYKLKTKEVSIYAPPPQPIGRDHTEIIPRKQAFQ